MASQKWRNILAAGAAGRMIGEGLGDLGGSMYQVMNEGRTREQDIALQEEKRKLDQQLRMQAALHPELGIVSVAGQQENVPGMGQQFVATPRALNEGEQNAVEAGAYRPQQMRPLADGYAVSPEAVEAFKQKKAAEALAQHAQMSALEFEDFKKKEAYKRQNELLHVPASGAIGRIGEDGKFNELYKAPSKQAEGTAIKVKLPDGTFGVRVLSPGQNLPQGEVPMDYNGKEGTDWKMIKDASGKPFLYNEKSGEFKNAQLPEGWQAETKTPKAKTEMQAKAKVSSEQAFNAESKLSKLENVDPSWFIQSPIPWTEFPERMKSEARKQFEQASEEFVEAALRFKTGASVTKDEVKNAMKIWIRQPGDSSQNIKDKAASRALLIREMNAASGSTDSPSLPSSVSEDSPSQPKKIGRFTLVQ